MRSAERQNEGFDIAFESNVLMDHENEFFIDIDHSYLVHKTLLNILTFASDDVSKELSDGFYASFEEFHGDKRIHSIENSLKCNLKRQ